MPVATDEKTTAELARDQLAEGEAIAAGVAEADAQDEAADRSAPLTWADVSADDEVEVFVFDAQHGWKWERREVLGVDGGGGEDSDATLIVVLRDPNEDRQYEIDGLTDAHALRWPEVPIEEDPSGQQRIGGPGTEPTFSTDAGGTPPHEAELSLKAKKIEWPTDLRRGSSVLLLVWAYVEEVRVASTKTFVAEIGRHMLVEHPTMRPHEVMDSLVALESRPRRDRAVIDQAAKIAAELVDGAGGIVDLDLAVAMRERLYDRYHIDDDAAEATHGTEDHEDQASRSDLSPPETALAGAPTTEGGE